MGKTEFTLKEATQPLDLQTAETVRNFWMAEGAPIKDVEERLGEVRILAYVNDELAGVGTLHMRALEVLQCNLLGTRVFVGADYRRAGGAHLITQALVKSMERQFNDRDNIDAIGAVVVSEAKFSLDDDRAPCQWGYPEEQDGPRIEFNLFKVTSDGRPQYVYYFENASLFEQGPVVEPIGNRLKPNSDSITLTFNWGHLTEAQANQVIGLWLGHGVMESREACLKRLPQVAALAWQGERVVGIASLFEVPYEPARAQFYGFRSFIAPEARGGSTATRLLDVVYTSLNTRYLQGELSEEFHGVAFVLQNERLNKQVHRPMGRDIRSVFIGFLNDMQLRVRYFDGATIARSPATHH
jgi:hypothetical protein